MLLAGDIVTQSGDDRGDSTNELLRHYIQDSRRTMREQTAKLGEIQLDLTRMNERMENRQATIERLERHCDDLSKKLDAQKAEHARALKELEKTFNAREEAQQKLISASALDAARAHEKLGTLWKAATLIAGVITAALIGLAIKLLGGS